MAYTLRQFLECKSAWASGFSGDASKVLIGSNLSGTTQLYRTDQAGSSLVQLTDREDPVTGRYVPRSDTLLVGMDSGGNERKQLYLMDDEPNAEFRPLVVDPEFFHSPGGFTRDGKTLAYGCNRRNGTDFDVYVRDVASDDERCVFDRGGWCAGGGFSPDGRYLAVFQMTTKPGDNEVYLVDLATGEIIHYSPHDDEASFDAPSWLPDGSAFYFATDTGSEFNRIARYDMATASWTTVLEDDWDLSCWMDDAGSRLLVVRNEEGFSRLRVYDPLTVELRGEVPLPGPGMVNAGSLSDDGRYLAYGFASPVEPLDPWLYDFETGRTTRLATSPGRLPPEDMVQPELHRYASFDGESIPVFLFRPKGGAEAPVVVSIHGGPESQYVPAFNPVTQFLVQEGFAVAAPNVRGSIGYGKRFQHLDDVYKRMDSVRDLEGLHDWLATQPGVDHTRAALMGGSYGGYMTLAGLAFQPERWAAGVDIVGISSLVTFLENTGSFRRKFREREYGSLEHDREFLESVSPITHVEAMRAPLFIIHGANDVRVPLGEAEQIHKILCERGVPCELLVYHDEGHGLNKLRNRLDAYPKATDFLKRWLT